MADNRGYALVETPGGCNDIANFSCAETASLAAADSLAAAGSLAAADSFDVGFEPDADRHTVLLLLRRRRRWRFLVGGCTLLALVVLLVAWTTSSGGPVLQDSTAPCVRVELNGLWEASVYSTAECCEPAPNRAPDVCMPCPTMTCAIRPTRCRSGFFPSVLWCPR